MKSYNIDNYLRYKEDLKETITKDVKCYSKYTRDELICLFLPLVENISRKFSTTTQASGVMDITDIIQEGSVALVYAVDNLDIDKITSSNNPEKTIKSFLSKRIKGSIRRAIDINRGSIRIPEYKLNEMRKGGDNESMLRMFFNSIFLSVDEKLNNDDDNADDYFYNMADESKEYSIDKMNSFLITSMAKHLGVNTKEYEVLRLSYGLDCDRCPALEIANLLGIEGPSAYVRISEIKKQAINKLSENMEFSQVIDIL